MRVKALIGLIRVVVVHEPHMLALILLTEVHTLVLDVAGDVTVLLHRPNSPFLVDGGGVQLIRQREIYI